MLDLHSTSLEELQTFVTAAGYPAFRGKQLYQWVQQKGVVAFDAMTNLPKPFLNWLQQEAYLTVPEILAESHAKDGGTIKFLLRWADGATTELVVMVYQRHAAKDRRTCCISTQVGCGMDCGFCATAIGGLVRNLTAGEMVAQVLLASRWCGEQGFGPITNVVYMGMGEPFANTAAVLKSVYLLNSPQGLNIGQRHLTISTCGLVPGIDLLSDSGLSVGLAVSLHSAIDEVRNQMMPVNRTYPVGQVIAACQRYTEVTGRRVTFEYALFEGKNDAAEDAQALGNLLKGNLFHVNVIPGNPVAETAYTASSAQQVAEFIRIVERYGVTVTLREARGLDIDGACGQLRRQYLTQ